MNVGEKDVTHIASLAKLELTEAELTRLVRDLNAILNYVDHLNQLDTSSVPGMTELSSDSSANAMREDIHSGLRESLPHELAMKNAPEPDPSYFIVPKVIER